MRFWLPAAIVLTLTVGGGAVWLLIERNAALRTENATLQRNADTRERIDDAIADPRTPADIVERLRRHAGQ